MKNIEDYKAVIFDFDGTLVDSMGLWHSIDHIYLERHNKACPETLPYEIAGKSFTETAEYLRSASNSRTPSKTLKPNGWRCPTKNI